MKKTIINRGRPIVILEPDEEDIKQAMANLITTNDFDLIKGQFRLKESAKMRLAEGGKNGKKTAHK